MPTVSLPKELKDQALAMFANGVLPREIGKRLNVKPATVSAWANRGGWLQMRDNLRQPIVSATVRVVEDTKTKLRDKVHESALRSAESLAKANPGTSLKRLRAFVDVLEPLSRVGDRLENWSGQQDGGLHLHFIESPFMPQPVVSSMPAQNPIDVESLPPVQVDKPE